MSRARTFSCAIFVFLVAFGLSAAAAVPKAGIARGGGAAPGGIIYVGSQTCLNCHAKEGWRLTQHAAAYIRPMPQYTLVPGKGVLAETAGGPGDDFIKGLDFNTISSAFDAYKPNAPKLSVKNGTYTITVGQLDLPVIFVLQWRWKSGAWEQFFGVRVPVGDSPTGLTGACYSAPLSYTTDGGWAPYIPEAWYDDSNQPRYSTGGATTDVVANCENDDQNCFGCHATGLKSIDQNARGEWVVQASPALLYYPPDDPSYFDYDGDGQVDIMNIGCESCHGPGWNHFSAGGGVGNIVNPAKLSAHDANDVCGQCHAVVASSPTGVIGWPYDEVNHKSFIPGSGDPLSNYFTDAEVWWPDGTTGQDTSQYPEFYEATGKANFGIRCFDCHESHAVTANSGQVIDTMTFGSVTINTRVEDDTFCLACHATYPPFSKITKKMVANASDPKVYKKIGRVVKKHTHHAYAPDGSLGVSRCTQCHMSMTAGADGSQSLSNHTFEVVPPQKTLLYQDQGGMPNACALSCHATQVDTFGLGVDPDIYSWDKPFDNDLATALMKYYGPKGKWWKLDVQQHGGHPLAPMHSRHYGVHRVRRQAESISE